RFLGVFGAIYLRMGALPVTCFGVGRIAFDVSLADRPALLLAALLIVLGIQIFALGLLGELIIFTHARQLKDYRVEAVIHYPESEGISSSAEAEPAAGGRDIPHPTSSAVA